MSFQSEHIGLYFGQSQIKLVQEQHSKYPHLQTAWDWLDAESGTTLKINKSKLSGSLVKPELDNLGQAIEAAFRYRFFEDENAAKKALAILQDELKFVQRDNLRETIQTTLGTTHCFEMLRERFTEAKQWLEEFTAFTDDLLNEAEDGSTLEQIWAIPLQIIRAVVLEDEALFEAGAARYRQAIDMLIHPEGYFKPLVEGEEDAVKIYQEMTLACAALVLAGEAATQAGLNLHNYQNRDVSTVTSATYLTYYYFYPEKWPWGDGLTENDTESIFREYGAWLDIMAHYQIPRGAELLLEQQRPFFNASIAGLTTLSHFKAPEKKRWRLFG